MNRFSRHYPTQEQLQEKFRYDAKEGLLIQRDGRGKGRTELTNQKYYRRTTIKYRGFPHHRLVWIYHHGDPGHRLIEHLNGNKLDDRIENLQLVTHRRRQRSAA